MKESQSMEQFVSDVFGSHLIPVIKTFPAQLYLLLSPLSPDMTGTPFIRHTEWKYNLTPESRHHQVLLEVMRVIPLADPGHILKFNTAVLLQLLHHLVQYISLVGMIITSELDITCNGNFPIFPKSEETIKSLC